MSRMLRDVVALLNRLIQLDYDAIEACKAALARVTDPRDREQLGAALGDHRRHIDELAILVRNLGGEPASQGDLRQASAKGKVVLGGLAGEGAVLEAMQENEEEARRAYEHAASQPGVPVDVLAVLERNLAHETEHVARLADRGAARR